MERHQSTAPNLLMPWLEWWLFPYWDPAQKEFMEGKKNPKKVALWDTSKLFCLIPGNTQRLVRQGPEQSHIVGGIHTHGRRVRTR